MVAKLESSRTGTARDYVDWLQENRISGDDINKGEKRWGRSKPIH